MPNTEEFVQRVQDCRELYLKYGGEHHELIEKEMRELGYRDFHRRSLYRRFERGTCKPGWIETYGWRSLLKEMRSAERSEDTPVLMDAASASRLNTHNHTSLHNDVHHAGGTGVEDKSVLAPSDFDEFKEWLKRVSPSMEWEWKHQVYIYKRLTRVTEGLCKRLMIFLPPRHGKSELVTVRYAAWRLKKDPSMNVILASYNQTLARLFSRKIKRVLCDDHELSGGVEEERSGGVEEKGSGGVEEKGRSPALPHSSTPSLPNSSSSFPFVRTRPKNTEAEWETTQGGGLRAVGVGSGVTGFGANLIIIDDPVKSRAEAESKTYRDRLWDWFNDDIYTRLEPDGSIILIQTRWHEDDLAGRLLRESQEEGCEQWTIVNLPALAERSTERSEDTPVLMDAASASNRNLDIHTTESADTHHAGGTGVEDKSVLAPSDPLGRSIGEALWPQRYNEETLDRYKRRLGSYSFAALYQQMPVPAEGGLFKRAWFKTINSPPPDLKWKRGYDLGISKNATADYTASLRIAFDRPGNMYIDGGFRRRIEYPEQRRYILGRIADERDTQHGVELSANGNAVIQDLRRERAVQGRMLRGVKVKGDKVTQALPWIALAEEGRIFLVRGHWNEEFIDEAASFPQGTHDDQIDAVSIAVRMHREQSGKLVTC